MVKANDNPEKRQLLTRQQVAAKYAIDPKTVTRFEQMGKIPRRIDWVGADPRWLESDLDAHIDQMARKARREQVA